MKSVRLKTLVISTFLIVSLNVLQATLNIHKPNLVVEKKEDDFFFLEINRFVDDLPNQKSWTSKEVELVRHGLRAIESDARRLLQNNRIHQVHDALKATVAKIRRLDRDNPDADAAIKIERLDAIVSNYAEVLPGRLYRGAQPSEDGLEWLAQQGIKTVISFCDEDYEKTTGYPGFALKDEKLVAQKAGLKYINLPVLDQTIPTPEQINGFLALIENSNEGPFFVHCKAGIGRAGIMSGLAQKAYGIPIKKVLENARCQQLNPETRAVDAMQAAFIETYPVTPFERSHPLLKSLKNNKSIILRHTLHDTSHAAEDLESVIKAGTNYEIDGNLLQLDGRSYLVNAHHPVSYQQKNEPFPSLGNPYMLHPARIIPRIIESEIFLKLDFKSPDVIDAFVSMTNAIPWRQKMGHAFLKELVIEGTRLHEGDKSALLSIADIKRAQTLLGKEIPFLVSCQGVTKEKLTVEFADRVAEKVAGVAKVINFNLPDRQNVPLKIMQHLWKKYGIAVEIKIDSKADRVFWNSKNLPYLGITDNPSLATPINTK